MRFRYFDTWQQAICDGEVRDPADAAELIGLMLRMPGTNSPAVEFTAHDGSSLVVGVSGTSAVLLWTDAEGRSSHSVSPSIDLIQDGVVFDYFGAYTEMPASYAVPVHAAVTAAEAYVRSGVAPRAVLAMT